MLGACTGVLALVAMTIVIPLDSSPPAARAGTSTSSEVTPSDCPQDPCTRTHALQTWQVADPSKPVLQRTLKRVTTAPAWVKVSETKNIKQRQVIKISWNGFIPSSDVPEGGYDPDSAYPDTTKYPVVVMECWGTDTGGPNGMDPTHCQGAPNSGVIHHLIGGYPPFTYATTNDKANPPNGDGPNPTDVYTGSRLRPLNVDTLGFTAVDKTHYKMLGPDSIPPSLFLTPTAPLPNNTLSTYSDAQGNRSNVDFEVRGGSDLPVLGCSYSKACTLEVIPIVRPYCAPSLGDSILPPQWRPFYDAQCLGDIVATYPNSFLNSSTWWLASQWKNRFSFPLQMAPQPGECPVVDQRPTVAVQGSEAAATAMTDSWSAYYCLNSKNTFKVTQTNSPEDAARMALANGNANAALTSLPVTGSPRPVVHAPVAATGWTVAYRIYDKHYQRYTNLTLSPLLLAKLITNSYTYAPPAGGGNPAVAGNPTALFADPEFRALNRGFESSGIPIEGNVVWDSQDSDLFAAMFAYIDADPEARAFLDGKPDAYSGMVVNPAYRGKLHPPQMGYQQLDTTLNRNSNDWCEQALPFKYYDKYSELQSSLEAAAVSVLNKRPPQVMCLGTSKTDYHWGLSPDHSKTVLAFTTVPMAEKYGLSLAKLQSHVANSRPVAPSGWEGATDWNTYSTMQAALGYTKQDAATGVTSPDFSVFPYNNAYPGTTAVYAAIPTCGLDKTLAGRLADFLDYAAGAGQTPGTGAGQLPPGYAPLPAVYADYTRTAAQAVRKQTCAVPPPPQDQGGGVRKQHHLPPPGSAAANNGRFGAAPGAGGAALSAGARPNAAKVSLPSVAKPMTTALTRGVNSWLASWGLPLLLIVGLLAGAAAPLVRMAGQPGHPMRRFVSRMGQRGNAIIGRVAATVRRQSP